MAHDTFNVEPENAGSVDAVYHTIDITALDSAGAEPYDPSAELGIQGANRYGVSVRGQVDASVRATYDHTAGELSVVNIADGSDVAADTAVGELLLHVVGV